MRTTLTINEQTDMRLRRIAAEQGVTYKEIINLALEKGLARLEVQEAPPAYKARTKNYGLQPGIDEDRLNQIVDDLQSEHDHP